MGVLIDVKRSAGLEEIGVETQPLSACVRAATTAFFFNDTATTEIYTPTLCMDLIRSNLKGRVRRP